MRFLLIIALSVVSVSCIAQLRLSSWHALKTIEFEEYFVTVGLSNGQLLKSHRIHISKISKSTLQVIDTVSYNVNERSASSIINPYSIKKLNQHSIVIVGVSRTIEDRNIGLILIYDIEKETFEKSDYFIGESTYILNVDVKHDSIIAFGVCRDTANANLRMFTLLVSKVSKDSQVVKYGCLGFEQSSGCELAINNHIALDDGYLLACQRYPYNDFTNRDGVLVRIDRNGNELWRKVYKNDSTTHHNFLITQLHQNNGFLIIWQDGLYKPYMSPQNWPITSENYNTTLWAAQINHDGQIIKKWNYGGNLKQYYSVFHPFNPIASTYVINASDSSIYIVGQTDNYVNDSTSTYVGFLISLDPRGGFKWFRQYYVDISLPFSGNQMTNISSITELMDGGFALSGNYQSPNSDSFPNGAQMGMVFFVDSVGCLEPGCNQSTNLVSPISDAQDKFLIYPNPNQGKFKVDLRNLNYSSGLTLRLYDNSGKIVLMKELNQPTVEITLETGLYVLELESKETLRVFRQKVVCY